MAEALLRIEGLCRAFGANRVLDRLGLEVGEGEILGLLGASGAGKTTLARIVAGLERADSGRVLLADRELPPLSGRDRALCRSVQLVFQDPYASLSPRLRVLDAVAEPLRIQRVPPPHVARVRETLARVGMAADTLAKLPGELSGGERQRVAVARALVLEPRLIVADEIVSMLDSCRKLEILDLLAGERARLGLSVLLVTHDVAVAASVCDRIAVMSRGKIVEIGQTARVLADPRDPYTAALIDAVPRL